MIRQLDVTYYLHSGFSCAMGDILCVFDYWTGEFDELPDSRRLTAAYLARFREVYVFISHAHPDHCDPVVYTWKRVAPVTYVISYDMPIGAQGQRLRPGDTLKLSDAVEVTAYDSTDPGISLMVTINGIKVFHAGDLNFWHWREEYSTQEIEDEEQDFHRAMAPLVDTKPDLAFFPLDPRLGQMFDAGANYFIMHAKPRVLVPMHCWERFDQVKQFALRSRSLTTEIIPMTMAMERMVMTFENGAITLIDLITPPPLPAGPAADPVSAVDDPDNPFEDTDMPVELGE